MKLIDYVFFRIYSFYRDKKDSTPIFMGCSVIAITFLFSLLSLSVIFNLVLKIRLESFISKPMILAFMAATIGLLVWRYNKKQVIGSLEEKYGKEEDSRKRRNAFYIFLYILIAFLTPITYGFLKHNLHYDI